MIPTGGIFDLAQMQERISEIEDISSGETFWGDPEKAREILKEGTQLNREINRWQGIEDGLEEVGLLAEMLQSEDDAESLKELQAFLARLKQNLTLMRLEKMMSGEHDAANAIVSINAGAGGTEAQD